MRLQKSLYGLRQANKQWFATSSTALKTFGYVQLVADHTLFVKNDFGFFTGTIGICDIVLTGNNLAEIHAVKSFVHSKFCIKDIGELEYFLGLEVARSSHGIVLN